MELKKIAIDNFKNIEKIVIKNLSDINVIVGGNNSGKSSLLQAIHFHTIAAIANRENGQQTFSSNLLMYSPSDDFTILRHNSPYTNFASNRADSRLAIAANSEDNTESKYFIKIYKGRNHGNIGCERTGDIALGSKITDPEKPFSIYVPGLAGVPLKEEYKALSLVRKGIASGDSNLYLRNVLLRIKLIEKMPELNSMLGRIFPNIAIDVNFLEERDEKIEVIVEDSEHGNYPLEMSGTGLQQVLQIISYIIYFNPSLLLLDEPDSHIHPDNQILLTNVLEQVVEEYQTKIILTTHSRVLIEYLNSKANFIWLKNGKKIKEGFDTEILPILLDIGALNEYEKLVSHEYDFILLTEDSDSKYLKKILKINNRKEKSILILSYKTSSKIWATDLFAEFINSLSIRTKIIVHRDRDFMTQDEVDIVNGKIEKNGIIPFITDYSDIEHYFLNENHINSIESIEIKEIQDLIKEIATQEHIAIQQQFSNKRDEIKRLLYQYGDSTPKTLDLLGNSIPVSFENIKGKFLLRKVNEYSQKKYGSRWKLMQDSEFLRIEKLFTALEN